MANRVPELRLEETLDVISERIEKLLPVYSDTLEFMPFSCARLSERCFILQDWDHKRCQLKLGQFHHVFQMPGPDGSPATACDCLDFKTGLCLHVAFVKQFGPEKLPTPVFDGEDPESFMFSMQFKSTAGELYFSVSTRSGTRHSQKRTIVSISKQTLQWRCRSCPAELYSLLLVRLY
jgi:hypothetical protein